MELRHLRYFAAVADTCHFGRAADRLHIAQPALSYAIRQLEAELGVSLFARTTRQVTLTAAGEFLKGEVDRILVGIDAAVDGVQRVAAGRSGVVRLGLTGIAVFSHLPRIARAVRSELPHVELRIVSDLLTPDQCDRLRDGAIDLGVLRPPVVGEGIEVRTIDVEPLVLAVASDHRLAVEPVVSVDDLRSESFVMYDSRDSAVNEAAVRTCRTAGFVPHRAHDASG
ncbi:LysR family transcriptional regulator, partial [Gordonia sihwensis]